MSHKLSAASNAASAPEALPTAAVRYRIDATATQAHLYRITLYLSQPQSRQQLALPAWIPGSYLLREFAKHLQNLRAEQQGQALPVQQLDKNTWLIETQGEAELQVHYEVYAFDPSVRTAWLDPERGFFNPTSLCLQALGLSEQTHELELVLDEKLAKNGVHAAQAAIKKEAGSSSFTACQHAHAQKNTKTPISSPSPEGIASAQSASTTQPVASCSHHYRFADYHQLADTPFVFAQQLWRGSFVAASIAHEFLIVGAPPNMDGEQLLADTRAICEAQQQFWGSQPPIFTRYVFLLHATEDGYGGLEHAASTALICARQDLPCVGESGRSKAYTTLLGLISHEYFHSWNVKRLRPAELAQYDYSRENYTQLLWFFEGFTSYYDDLFLRRAGLISEAAYLQLLVRNIQALAINPGAQVQSVAQASFDAWTKYYRPDENTLNATVSYYTKGALVALCLDLTLRREGQGSLDAVMQTLWRTAPALGCSGEKQAKADSKNHAAGNIKPISEADIAAALQQVGQRSYAPELQAWVHGRGELPLQELLAAHGISWHTQPLSWAQRLGIKVQEGKSSSATSLKIQAVLRGSCAERAGLAPGDEWLGLIVDGQSWRLTQLAQLAYLLPASAQAGEREVGILYCREQRIHTGVLQLEPAAEGLHELRLPSPPAQLPASLQAWLRA